uniref:Uncharacterized protein n=1 Tax=Anguilla anguilla TaxID=7936 RepID=A0A0E9PBF9_ANGAN
MLANWIKNNVGAHLRIEMHWCAPKVFNLGAHTLLGKSVSRLKSQSGSDPRNQEFY